MRSLLQFDWLYLIGTASFTISGYLISAMAVSCGCGLAAATLIPGSVAARVAKNVKLPGAQLSETKIGIENPAGILEATVVARYGGGGGT